MNLRTKFKGILKIIKKLKLEKNFKIWVKVSIIKCCNKLGIKSEKYSDNLFNNEFKTNIIKKYETGKYILKSFLLKYLIRELSIINLKKINNKFIEKIFKKKSISNPIISPIIKELCKKWEISSINSETVSGSGVSILLNFLKYTSYDKQVIEISETISKIIYINGILEKIVQKISPLIEDSNSGNYIRLLGRIAVKSNEPDSIISLLRVRLCRPRGPLDTIITQTLSYIYEKTHNEEIIKLFDSILRIELTSPEAKQYQYAIEEIIESLIIIKVPSPIKLLKRIIKIFNQLCESYFLSTVRSGTNPTSIAGHVAPLLPLIAKYIKYINKSIHSLVYQMWIYIFLFGFSVDIYIPEWFSSVKIISKYVPILIKKNTTESIGKMEQMIKTTLYDSSTDFRNLLFRGILESDEILNPNRDRIELREWAKLLKNNLKKLSNGKCLYLLAILHLENLRIIETGKFHITFSYLNNENILIEEDFCNILQDVIRQVFPLFLLHISKLNTNRSEILDEQVKQLLISFCSRHKRVRTLAYEFIRRIVERFKQALWGIGSLRIILDLLDIASSRIIQYHEGPVLGLIERGESYGIDLEIEEKHWNELTENLLKVAIQWYSNSVEIAPNEIINFLQEYIQDLNSNGIPISNHPGIALSISIIADLQKPIISSQTRLINYSNNPITNILSSIGIKNKYLGRVKAFIEMNKSEIIINSIQLFKNVDSISINEISQKMYTLAALIIISNKKPLKLLHNLVRIPFQKFNKEAIKIGCFCWRWVSSVKPEIEVQLLSEITDAWRRTIVQKIGLFELNNPCDFQNPYNKNLINSQTSNNVESHSLLLDWLIGRFNIVCYSRPHAVDLYYQILTMSFDEKTSLSYSPDALGARFRLGLLGLMFIDGWANTSTARLFIQQRVFKIMINWFTTPQRFHQNPSTWKSDIRILINVSKELVNLNYSQQQQQLPQNNQQNESKINYPPLIESRIISQNYFTISASSRPRILSKYLRQSDSSKLLNSTKASNLILNLEKEGRLLRFLIRNEINNISIWYNPLNLLPLEPGERENIAGLNVPKSTLESYIKQAWESDFRVALYFPERIPSGKGIFEIVQKYVLKEPLKAINEPSIVKYLINTEYEYLLKTHVKYSLNPCYSLQLLDGTYSDITQEYAVKSLTKFPIKELIFYLPQLVQALKFDRRNLLRDFLLEKSKESSVLTHQLIWNLISEKNSSTAIGIGPKIASDLLEILINSFTKIQEEKYKMEMKFVELFTDISGSLISIPEIKRKEQLNLKLNDIILPKFCYLPTNPEFRVLKTVLNSGRPLPSHAKVPIIVGFEVEKVDILDIDTDKIDINVDTDTTITTTIERCIFKSGDDIRQDMLSLQIIELVKRVFDNIGLKLFLYPYKVIATDDGCGIIEVVKNATSRDAVGRVGEGDLFEIFLNRYGTVESRAFRKAQSNFIESMAAYSIISYLLQIKDRHNGNIMISEKGHIIHIDFGFIFDISPGGEMIRFEDAPFKLSREMIRIMGDHVESEPFIRFITLVCKGFLAIRPYMNDIVALASLLKNTGLDCFRKGGIQRLINRFQPNSSPREAVNFIVEKIKNSYNRYTTMVYDQFQKWQNELLSNNNYLPIPDPSVFERTISIKRQKLQTPQSPRIQRIPSKFQNFRLIYSLIKGLPFHVTEKSSVWDSLFFDKLIIGRGSFSEVIKCRLFGDESKNVYALKRSTQIYRSEKDRLLKLREVEINIDLFLAQHKYVFESSFVLKTLFSFEENGRLFIGSNYCKGGNLDNKVLNEESCWIVLTHILLALKFIHKKGYVHLDVKPENILSCNNKYILCDFGLMTEVNKPFEIEGDSRFLAPGILGLIEEQPRALPEFDIYSLGLTIYQLVTGYDIPNSGSAWEMLRHCDENPLLFPDFVSIDLQNLITLMLSTNKTNVTNLLKFPKILNIIDIYNEIQEEKWEEIDYRNLNRMRSPLAKVFRNSVF